MHWSRGLRLIPLALHLCLCLAVAFNPRSVEGSWRWFPVFYVDFPFSILLLPLLKILKPLFVFAIAGTLWWFFLGMVVSFALGKGAEVAHRLLDRP
jgi:hypothetical protein